MCQSLEEEPLWAPLVIGVKMKATDRCKVAIKGYGKFHYKKQSQDNLYYIHIFKQYIYVVRNIVVQY